MHKYSVLIVDDNEDDRYILKRYLNKADVAQQIFEVGDGKDALAFFKNYGDNKAENPDTYPPAVIFLDVNMPLVDGFEFLEKFSHFRDSQDLQSVVVMMFSSSGRQEDKNRAFAFPFVKDYLIKGDIKHIDFRKTIEMHCA